ncbi:N-(5'-phosphoribosyl)anthranilate isomerase [Acidianus sp. HS-5]|uniref:phosphoribosylanthranilate isomerase n=1 Tax=Acidianus sp. HS-5 TaxID=2886040 RepID=UPI001F258A4D|nr:N-(5'-phosphoribosyl)anthranilate isomerase [Acidianus sp. HS-5]BDC19873.1 N-(5'-phosphoribosyl)anthranilate isomerase [Acidianus sp. HS-5]
MSIKLKICGIATLQDVLDISRMNVDYIGIVTDPISKRYAKDDFVDVVKKFSCKPTVSVKVNGKIPELIEKTKHADLLQIHRVLNNSELEELRSYDKRVILYVPASEKYMDYLKNAIDYSDMILLDSLKKGISIDLSFVKKAIKEYSVGVGGGININNIDNIIEINPKWIDISSGVEKYPGKKDMIKVIEIVKRVKA